MAAHNQFLSNEHVIPLIESSGVFKRNLSDRFAIAHIGESLDSYAGSESIHDAYLRLRANVYIDQTGMLESELRREDGTEVDQDDERSAHFAVVENRLTRVAVMACMRLIEKTDVNDRPLPIEEFFPDIFKNEPAPNGSIEVSRFIVRHDEKVHKLGARAMLLASALAYTRDRGLGPALAVVEPEFEEHLTKIGVPIERIAEPKWVPEYNDYNLGIIIDTEEMAQRIGHDAVKSCLLEPGTYRYWGDFDISASYEDLPEVV